MTDEESQRELYLDAVFAVTSGDAWERVKHGIQADINNVVAQELQAETLNEIMELRGFRSALEYVHNLRELAKTEKATNA